MSYVLGADLGATNLRIAVGAGGEVISRVAAPVPSTGAALARAITDAAAGQAIEAAAIGVPGTPHGDGFAGFIAGATGITGAPLRALLEDALGVPVAIENDLNLAALAEHDARAVDDLAFIGVGTGVGMGIVAGGRLLRGAGAAGEVGHLPYGGRVAAGPDGLGPLEAVAGGAGLAARWGDGSARDVFAAAERRDPRAERLLDEQAEALATAVRAVRVLLDPEVVVLGGGIGCRPDVVARVAALGVEVEASAVGEDAGLVGALLRARSRA